jgi:hypothetical protein
MSDCGCLECTLAACERETWPERSDAARRRVKSGMMQREREILFHRIKALADATRRLPGADPVGDRMAELFEEAESLIRRGELLAHLIRNGKGLAEATKGLAFVAEMTDGAVIPRSADMSDLDEMEERLREIYMRRGEVCAEICRLDPNSPECTSCHVLNYERKAV